MASKPRTLYEKIWDAHVVERRDDGTCLIYIDRHLVHEVTSPQAFEALRSAGRKVRRPDLTLAVPDHNLPTTARRDGAGQVIPIADPESAQQLAALERNAPEFGIRYIGDADAEQGIVHVVGPEQGFSLPGATIVCGDSHTASHGGLGALAFGIGTSEVEHVLATQTLLLKRSKTMEVRVEGQLGAGVSAKDLVLHICGQLGAAGGTGYVIEYTGSAIRDLSIEGRLTVSNMAIEHGARAGLVAPDDKTFAYVEGRPYAPKGADWDKALAWWRSLATDPGATYDKVVVIDAADIAPSVTWGTSPEDVVPITATVPAPDSVPPCRLIARSQRAGSEINGQDEIDDFINARGLVFRLILCHIPADGLAEAQVQQIGISYEGIDEYPGTVLMISQHAQHIRHQEEAEDEREGVRAPARQHIPFDGVRRRYGLGGRGNSLRHETSSSGLADAEQEIPL